MSASLCPRPATLFPHRFAAWQRQGLSSRAASVVSLAECDTVEQIAGLGRAYFEAQPNCAKKTLTELAALAGWPPKRRTAVDAIAAALAMGLGPEEAREAAADALSALRLAGFVIVASRRREARPSPQDWLLRANDGRPGGAR